LNRKNAGSTTTRLRHPGDAFRWPRRINRYAGGAHQEAQEILGSNSKAHEGSPTAAMGEDPEKV